MWKVEKDKSLRESNPGIDAIPAFQDCSDKQLMYIYLVYDWTSPIYKAKLDVKKKEAVRISDLGMESDGTRPNRRSRDIMNLKNKKINEAIAKFNILQRMTDPDRALLEALQTQINDIMDTVSIPSENNLVEAKKKADLTKLLPTLIKQRKEIADTMEIRDVSVAEEEEILRELSTLDEYNEESQRT